MLAVPGPVAAGLLPALTVPDAFEAILNLHYLADAPATEAPFIGVVGGLAEWVFIKPGIVSVTISAANRLADVPPDTLAAQVWPDVRAACPTLPEAMPAFRVVREKRATFRCYRNAAKTQTSGRRRGTCKPRARGRLDGDRVASHHRGQHTLG